MMGCSSQSRDSHASLTRDFRSEIFEHLVEMCSDKGDSVPFCLLLSSNFQSSAMFEGSESGEVDGGRTESTVASSISACKKVRTENSVSCTWITTNPRLSVCSSTSLFSHLLVEFVFPLTCVCVLQAVQEILISSPWVSVTPRGCVIRVTVRSSPPSRRFIITQWKRVRQGGKRLR